MSVLGVGAVAMADATEPAFHVSPAGNDAWSGTLPSPAPGGSDGPFASMERARDAMRAQSDTKTVYLRGGNYYLTESLRLDASDSGTSWLAYSGEQPVLHGGLPVEGWRKSDGPLWEAKVSPEILAAGGVVDFFVDGRRQVSARTPNADPQNPLQGGWRFADESSGQLPRNSHLRFRDGDVPNYADLSSLKVSVFAGAGYDNNVFEVARIERKNRIVLFSNPHWRDVSEGSRYFLFGAREDLDAPGEWYFDREAGTLYHHPQKASFDGDSAVAGSLVNFIEIEGRLDSPVRDIAISGLEFRNGSPFDTDGNVSRYSGPNRYGAVRIVHAENVTVSDSRFQNLGRGITVDGSSDVSIVGNEFLDLAATAIRLRDGSGTGATHDVNIIGNTVRSVAQLYKHDMGVHFENTFDVRIAENLFENLPGSAIGGGSLKNSRVGTYRITIESNEIRSTNLELNDGGAIYIIGRKRLRTGDIIRYNRISDTKGLAARRNGSWRTPRSLIAYAIYLDDFASGTEVYGNVMVNNLGGIHIHGGRENIVTNNIFWNSDISIQMDHKAGPEWGKNIIKNNIIYSDDFDMVYPGRWNKAASVEEANEIDHNLFWSKYPRWQELEPVYQLDGPDQKTFSGRPGLTRAGSLKTTVPASHFTSPSSSIKIHAYGQPRRGVYPTFSVIIGGKKLGDFQADRHLQTFEFEVDLAPGQDHEVEISYAKNPNLAPHHQILYVPGLEVNGETFVFWPHAMNGGSFNRWQKRRGLDRGSLLADPLFIDPEAGDFRLRSDSPALTLGFKALPWDRIGTKTGLQP